MMNNVMFVKATENDVLSIISLRQKIWGTTYRGIYPDSMIDDFDYVWHREQELARIKHPSYSVYLIVMDNQNIGYLTMKKTNIITLQSLYVVSEYQKQGIGRKAFEFIRDYCTNNNAMSFICHCVPTNFNARQFYERMGGKVVGEDLENEEQWQNSVVYQFNLT